MTRHADGRIEGTPEDLATYARLLGEGPRPVRIPIPMPAPPPWRPWTPYSPPPTPQITWTATGPGGTRI